MLATSNRFWDNLLIWNGLHERIDWLCFMYFDLHSTDWEIFFLYFVQRNSRNRLWNEFGRKSPTLWNSIMDIIDVFDYTFYSHSSPIENEKNNQWRGIRFVEKNDFKMFENVSKSSTPTASHRSHQNVTDRKMSDALHERNMLKNESFI